MFNWTLPQDRNSVMSLVVVLVFFSASLSCVADARDFTLDLKKLQGEYGHTHGHLDPEVYMTAEELVTTKGFPFEDHWVTTKDGYILRLFRIPHGRKVANTTAPKPAVILQHGLLGSGTNWLTNLVDESLAYILADKGADVWIGNSRGNIYSKNHTTLSPKSKKFWDFTWDDMAKYDLPAMVDYVRNVSKVGKVNYVGHSQGTTIAFAGLSENPGLNKKIKNFIALAPVTRIWHSKSPLTKLAPFAKTLSTFVELLGDGEFLADQTFTKWLAGHLCNHWGSLCADIMFVGCGFDFRSFNSTRAPVYVAHNPGGTSVMNILHWAQETLSHNFQKFDYGNATLNMRHYKQPTPPQYNLHNIRVPVAMFTGGRDWMAVPEDVEWILPQIKVSLFVDVAHYAHLDFIWAFDAPTYIYDKFMPLIFPKS